jgi:hypothetical protein
LVNDARTAFQPWAAFFGLVIPLFTIDLLFGSRGTDLRAAMFWSAICFGTGLASCAIPSRPGPVR